MLECGPERRSRRSASTALAAFDKVAKELGCSELSVTNIDELQDIDGPASETHMRPVRHHLGITAFGTNAWTAANVGDRLMPEHEEDAGSEELYVVLRGYEAVIDRARERWRQAGTPRRSTTLPAARR